MKETRAKKTKTKEPSTVIPCSPKRRFPKGKKVIWWDLNENKKNVVLTNGFHFKHANNSLHKSMDKILQEKHFVVCWFINEVNSSSLSNTQYFNPLCNKTKIHLALFLKKNARYTAEYTSTLKTPILKILKYVFYNIFTMRLEKFEFPPVYTN